MSIEHDIAALEKALEAQQLSQPEASAPFMTRRQLRRLLDALKEARKAAWGGALLRKEAEDAMLSKALELLKGVAPIVLEHASGFGEPDDIELANDIDAFLKEAQE